MIPHHDFVSLHQSLLPPQKFPENNRKNNSPLLNIPPLVNLLWKTLMMVLELMQYRDIWNFHSSFTLNNGKLISYLRISQYATCNFLLSMAMQILRNYFFVMAHGNFCMWHVLYFAAIQTNMPKKPFVFYFILF